MPQRKHLKLVALLGIFLLVCGIGLFGYSLSIIKQHELSLTTTEMCLTELWNYENSVDWWRNAYLTLFLPLTAVFITIGGFILVLQPILTVIYSKKTVQNLTDTAKFASPTNKKQEMEQKTLQ